MSTKSGIAQTKDIRQGKTLWLVEVCLNAMGKWSARGPKALCVWTKVKHVLYTQTDDVTKTIYVTNESFFRVGKSFTGLLYNMRYNWDAVEEPSNFPKDRLFVSYRAAKKYADSIEQQCDPYATSSLPAKTRNWPTRKETIDQNRKHANVLAIAAYHRKQLEKILTFVPTHSSPQFFNLKTNIFPDELRYREEYDNTFRRDTRGLLFDVKKIRPQGEPLVIIDSMSEFAKESVGRKDHTFSRAFLQAVVDNTREEMKFKVVLSPEEASTLHFNLDTDSEDNPTQKPKE